MIWMDTAKIEEMSSQYPQGSGEGEGCEMNNQVCVGVGRRV